MDSTKKEYKTSNFLVFINYLILILLGYLIYKNQLINSSLFGLGGSLTIFTIEGILISLSYFVTLLILELSFGTLIITGILIFNFLSYLEISGKTIDTNYLIISYLCLYSFISIYLVVVRLPFKKMSDLGEPERNIFLKKIIFPLFLPILVFGLVLGILSGLMTYFIHIHDPNVATSCPLLKISYMAVFWIVIGLLVTFIYLTKLKDEDIKNFIDINKRDTVRYDIRKIKKYFAIIFFSIILLGSFGEVIRGMWIMWIETILLLGLMSLIIWKIYKHIFYLETN